VFINPATLEPFEDQWTFLSTLRPLSAQSAIELVMPRGTGDWADASTYRRTDQRVCGTKPPPKINARSEAMLAVDPDRHAAGDAGCTQTPGLTAQPGVLREGAAPLLDVEHPPFIRCYRETLDSCFCHESPRKAHGIVADAGANWRSRMDVRTRPP